MATGTDLRRMALALKGTTEGPRTLTERRSRSRVSTSTLPADGRTANFKFTPDEQQFKCMMAPDAFAPIPNAGAGKAGLRPPCPSSARRNSRTHSRRRGRTRRRSPGAGESWRQSRTLAKVPPSRAWPQHARDARDPRFTTAAATPHAQRRRTRAVNHGACPRAAARDAVSLQTIIIAKQLKQFRPHAEIIADARPLMIHPARCAESARVVLGTRAGTPSIGCLRGRPGIAAVDRLLDPRRLSAAESSRSRSTAANFVGQVLVLDRVADPGRVVARRGDGAARSDRRPRPRSAGTGTGSGRAGTEAPSGPRK